MFSLVHIFFYYHGIIDVSPFMFSVHTVERIVNKRRQNGRNEYLIKWEGYLATDNTWEPENNMHCDQLIAEYEKEKKLEEASFAVFSLQAAHKIEPGVISRRPRVKVGKVGQ